MSDPGRNDFIAMLAKLYSNANPVWHRDFSLQDAFQIEMLHRSRSCSTNSRNGANSHEQQWITTDES